MNNYYKKIFEIKNKSEDYLNYLTQCLHPSKINKKIHILNTERIIALSLTDKWDQLTVNDLILIIGYLNNILVYKNIKNLSIGLQIKEVLKKHIKLLLYKYYEDNNEET